MAITIIYNVILLRQLKAIWLSVTSRQMASNRHLHHLHNPQCLAYPIHSPIQSHRVYYHILLFGLYFSPARGGVHQKRSKDEEREHEDGIWDS